VKTRFGLQEFTLGASEYTHARDAGVSKPRPAKGGPANGVTVCSGGIIGMGESLDDRCAMLMTLANLDPQPESVPVNALVPSPGTPLADRPPVDTIEFVRMIATARILMPKSKVRLSAGRLQMSREAQVLCFLAGANSVFYGEKLLTTGNPDVEADRALLRDAGMRPAPPSPPPTNS